MKVKDKGYERSFCDQPHKATPRRFWDLHSNRVIPWASFDFKRNKLWVISHSWVEDSDRFLARTAINGYDWPVPLPKGVTLESVRDELIGHGAEYFWLDVLCLRQEDRSGMRQLEELREVEWALDVPTIGNIYSNYASEVVRYYNGLGRPLKTNGWDSDFHWTNRALTLQESLQSITGGVSAQESELLSSASIEDGRYMRYTIAQFELSESTVRISQLLKKPASSCPVT